MVYIGKKSFFSGLITSVNDKRIFRNIDNAHSFASEFNANTVRCSIQYFEFSATPSLLIAWFDFQIILINIQYHPITLKHFAIVMWNLDPMTKIAIFFFMFVYIHIASAFIWIVQQSYKQHGHALHISAHTLRRLDRCELKVRSLYVWSSKCM